MSDSRSLPDSALLDRYLAGECTPDEEAALRQRFGDADPRVVVRDALRGENTASRFDSTHGWSEVQARFAKPARSRITWPSGGRLLRIAAAIVFLAGGAIVVPRIIARSRPVAEAELIATTGIGERREVHLSDGTSVMLAPLSALRYPARFGTAERTVTLSGQASFSAAHDAARPFSVRAAGLTARVLGTEFDVREDTAAHAIDVVVASGRVRLQTPIDSAGPILTARQHGHVDVASGRITVSEDVRIEDFIGWRTGHLRFDRRPLRDVTPELERWFDVDFQVADSALASRTLSADLRVGEKASLEALLGAITLPIDARYQRQGRTVIIVRR